MATDYKGSGCLMVSVIALAGEAFSGRLGTKKPGYHPVARLRTN